MFVCDTRTLCLQEISICHKYHGTRQRKLQVVINKNAFVELLNDHFLERLNTTPTRGNNTLDIVLTNIPNKVKICEILSPVQQNFSPITTLLPLNFQCGIINCQRYAEQSIIIVKVILLAYGLLLNV